MHTVRIPKKKKIVYEVGLGAKGEKCNIYSRCRIVVVSRGGKCCWYSLRLVATMKQFDCPWWKMLTFPKFGIVVIRLGATYRMAYCPEKCKEIWNVCTNKLYLIWSIIPLSPVDQAVDGKPRRSRICTSKIPWRLSLMFRKHCPAKFIHLNWLMNPQTLAHSLALYIGACEACCPTCPNIYSVVMWLS